MECQVPDVDGSGVGASGVDGSGVGASGVDGSGEDAGAGVDGAGVDDSDADGAGVDGAGVDVGAGDGVFDDDGSALAVSGAASDNPGTPVAVSRPSIVSLPWTLSHPITPVRFA